MKQDKQEWIDRAVDFLDRAELWGMTLITKVIAFLTPIPVSLQTKTHAMKYLDYSEFWSWVIALIVEFLGYASIYKALQFAEHNRRYTDPKNKAPFKLAIATYIFYLIAVIVFNVIPEIATQKASHIIAMNIVLALFSVPGGVIAGISAIFTERKAAMKRSSGTTSESRLSKPTFETPTFETPKPSTSRTSPQPMGFRNSQTSESKTGRPSVHQERVYEYMNKVFKDENRVASFAEVERDLELPQSTASRLRNSWVDKNVKGDK